MERPQSRFKKRFEWTLAGAAAASWWALAIWMQQSGAAGEYLRFALLGIPGLLIAGFLRRKPSAILVWLPTALCIALFTSWGLIKFLSFRSLPGSLDGIVAIIYLGSALVGLALSVAVYFTRPRVFRIPLSVASIANCVGVVMFSILVDGSPSGEPHYITVLSPDGRPVAGAEVRYNVFGYGEGGGRTDRPTAIGGPILTSASGQIVLYSGPIRREIEGTVTKQGFRPVTFLLGMQYSEWDDSREFSWGTGPMGTFDQHKENYRNSSKVNSKPPIRFVIYLPDATQLPEPLLHYDFYRRNTPDTGLNLVEAQFVPLNRADISFDFLPNPGSTNREFRLRITGLRGTELQIPPKIKPETKDFPFDSFWLRAPDQGYTNTIEIPNREDRERPVFIRCLERGFYARLYISGYPDKVNGKACVNTNGSPWLEFDPKRSVDVSYRVK